MLTLVVCAAPARADDTHVELEGLRNADVALAQVIYRLALANDELCVKRAPITGLVVHAAADYSPNIQAEAIRFFKFKSPVAVEAVITGGPAADAGIGADDSILAINGKPLAGSATKRQVLEQIDSGGFLPITLQLRDEDRTRSVTIHPKRGCLAHAEIVVDGDRNAGTDGDVIQLNTGLYNLVDGDDDLLAAIIAHELAHIVLDHPARLTAAHVGRGLFQGLGRGGRLIRRTEDEADRLSVVLMANAGYDPEAAVRYWRTIGPRLAKGGGFNAVHASWQERAALIQHEVDALPRSPTLPIVPAWIASRDQPLDAR